MNYVYKYCRYEEGIYYGKNINTIIIIIITIIIIIIIHL